jgi:2-polyprenyl-3-methyl-5-hydroxy-6-metoxy-1,4-benzoquinol methylase
MDVDVDKASAYGWNSSRPEPGHAWIDPIVLSYCRDLRANRILDLGCGNGALCGRLVENGYDVVGCDPDPSGIEICRRTISGAEFKTLGVYDDPRAADLSGFDVVISTEDIEHLLLPRHLIRFARSVLKPGGHLIITTPYNGYLKNLVASILNRWDLRHDVFWDYGHVKFFSPRTLARMLEDEEFQVTAFRGAGRVAYLWHTMVMVAQKLDSNELGSDNPPP